MANSANPVPKTYIVNGETTSSAPTVSFFDSLYAFGGLYLTTLFSLDTWAAAQASPFSTQGRQTTRAGVPPTSRTSGRGFGAQPRTLGDGGFSLNLGGNEVRTPGCGSCG